MVERDYFKKWLIANLGKTFTATANYKNESLGIFFSHDASSLDNTEQSIVCLELSR